MTQFMQEAKIGTFNKNLNKHMGDFKKFLSQEDKNNIEKTLDKLPSHHKKLVKGYKFIFETESTLKNDKNHVGMIINHPQKIIRLAAPWLHSRSFVLLHEIAHLVYEAFVRGTKLEKKWQKIAMSTKNRKKNENAEELFCHAYGATYCDYPPIIHYHKNWIKFIKNLP